MCQAEIRVIRLRNDSWQNELKIVNYPPFRFVTILDYDLGNGTVRLDSFPCSRAIMKI